MKPTPATMSRTQRLDFSRANMLAFDPQPHTLSIVRDMARSMGFAQARALSRLEQVAEALEQSDYQLLLLGCDGQLPEVCHLVRRIRHGDLGDDPFTVTIVTSVGVSEKDAAALVNSGTDTVICKPFSAESLYKRLVTLVRARKLFVATPHYIGPDRRDGSRAKAGDIPLLAVPNTLARSVANSTDGLEAEIAEARQAIVKQQADRLIVEMKTVIDRVAASAREGALTAEQCAAAAESLAASVEMVAAHVRKGNYHHLTPLLAPAEQAAALLAQAGRSDKKAIEALIARLARLAGVSTSPGEDSAD